MVETREYSSELNEDVVDRVRGQIGLTRVNTGRRGNVRSEGVLEQLGLFVTGLLMIVDQ